MFIICSFLLTPPTSSDVLSKWLLLYKMELAISVQILDEALCVSLCNHDLKKSMNTFVFSPTNGENSRADCNKKNDLQQNSKRARMCFACEVRKHF